MTTPVLKFSLEQHYFKGDISSLSVVNGERIRDLKQEPVLYITCSFSNSLIIH